MLRSHLRPEGFACLSLSSSLGYGPWGAGLQLAEPTVRHRRPERCRFYAGGHTGAVLQTPMHLRNWRDARGRPLANSVRLQIARELPVAFRMAGKQQINEQPVYSVFANCLTASVQTGVAVCGGSVVKPLAGRSEDLPGRS